MKTRSKWLLGVTLVMVLFLLGACEETKDKSEKTNTKAQEGSSSKTEAKSDKPMLISEALDKYNMWFKTDGDPNRNSKVRDVYVFKDGKAIHYYQNTSEPLTLEKINSMTDKEVIEFLEKEDKDSYKSEGDYKLDIMLDQLGQTTENITLVINNKLIKRVSPLESFAFENIGSDDSIRGKYNNDEYAYLKALKDGKEKVYTESEIEKNKIINHEVKGDFQITTKEIDEESELGFIQSFVHQTIFKTTYAGIFVNADESLITRVEDDSYPGLILDTPEEKGKGVTIESIKK
ncbi:hypothetical protein [Bacillus altitudinis]|uniref:Lipoprotein n=1 Tax=Bacillus altitudinis TaxID=293387 RepID=A0ABV1S953_BACAB|nr:hypothetical protein [Bacillus altitudinis]NOL32993.1 hypothetical protein [Bacillus altitudinis]